MCPCTEQKNLLFPAHLRSDGAVQTVAQHCREAAEIASTRLAPLGLSAMATLAGLMHDSGKMTNQYKKYITDAAAGRPVRRGSVNHTFAGVKYLLETFHCTDSSFSYGDIACELIAYAVGSHHGQFDVADADGNSGFTHRLARDDIHYDEAMGHFLEQCASRGELETLFQSAVQEIEACIQAIRTLPDPQSPLKANEELMFYTGQLARLLLSAVIEGDRLSTAAFMDPRLNIPPSNIYERREIWRKALHALEEHLAGKQSDKPINQARREISCMCADFAGEPPGLFRLNIPTGGGKTLSGLRLALAHAEKWNKRHVFYIAPLITIIEQNANAIRDAVGCKEWVLEHHSNIIRSETDEEELQFVELLEENWDAPIIVTTLVQFLNTLFSGATSCVRRFQALTDSVIIIDEVQTVPTHMLSLFNLAMNFLTGVCASTVVLCSATQPCFEDTNHPLKISDKVPVPHNVDLWRPFARTKIMDAGAMRLENIPDLVKKVMEKAASVLLVCNKKGEAEDLYYQLKRDDLHCCHLSASMCVAHRKAILESLYDALSTVHSGGRKVLCVSTQLIEAGVDISFDCVIRLCAGMDSVVQSAGRCNRNGESQVPAPVWIVRCENEKLTGLKEIQRGRKATGSLLHAFQQDSARFMDDLASDEAIRFYYHTLYADIRSDGETSMDYPINEPRTTLLDLLSVNRKFVRSTDQTSGFFLRQAFKTAGRFFSVFDDDTAEVIVPHGNGKRIIEQLKGMDERWQLADIADLLKQAKPYMVSVYNHQVGKLQGQGALMALCNGSVLALMDDYYSEETGLITNRMMNCFLEV